MIHMPFRALALASLLGPAAAIAAEQATFDLYISGLKAGEVRLMADEAAGRYIAASEVSTAGLASLLVDFGFDGEASGTLLDGGTVQPARFVATSRSPRAERLTVIEFEDGTPVHVSVEPPRSTAPDPAEQDGTLDPVSASFALLRANTPDRICNTSVDLFDGSRRSRLMLGPAVPHEGGFVCPGRYARIEGEAHSAGTSAREVPFRLVFRPNGEGLVELERIETETRFGRAVVERRG